MYYYTYTSVLSTSFSSRGLTLAMGYLILRLASRLDAFSVYPFPTCLPCDGIDSQQVQQRSVHPGPLVLRTDPLNILRPRRIGTELSHDVLNPARVPALMGEQPNPWDQLQPQDATSRHRGAKPCRRYGLLGKISLLSPGYLLSVERPRTHVPWPDH